MTKTLEIWVVDDDESIRWVMQKSMMRAGMKVQTFEGAAELFNALEDDQPDVLVSDIRMPGVSGLELMERVRRDHPGLPVIIMTAHSDLDSAVASYKGGAFEYLAKPFDVNVATDLVRRAATRREVVEPLPELGGTAIIGEAPAMQEVFRAIGRLSQSQITVMITGESGTGKELVARALHVNSPRNGKPFIPVNTAAIPKDLMESEFFGHERGAFTGAQTQRKGRFEQADGGTLFLDEIGDMPADLQTRLLRVLQNGEFYRVGGVGPVKVDVRVFAATHQDLEQLVKEGRFREDLYHRLNVIRIRIPSLAERSQDIPLLMRHFLAQAAKELQADVKRVLPEVMERLQRFDWPGNVRQLENVCRWLTVMAPGQDVHLVDLPPELREDDSPSPAPVMAGVPRPPQPIVQPPRETAIAVREDDEPIPVAKPLPSSTASSSQGGQASAAPAPAMVEPAPWNQVLREWADAEFAGGRSDLLQEAMPLFERTLIEAALRATRGQRQEAARRLGWGRNTLTRKIQDLGMDD
ncbi:MAG: nitrogen regulation protein NR(I) [Panacagrimonas sp.]